MIAAISIDKEDRRMTGNTRCQPCLNRPSGLEGHDHLNSSRSGPASRLIFKCSACGARWAREYEGSGLFVWIDLGEDRPVSLAPPA